MCAYCGADLHVGVTALAVQRSVDGGLASKSEGLREVADDGDGGGGGRAGATNLDGSCTGSKDSREVNGLRLGSRSSGSKSCETEEGDGEHLV